jgi:DNA-binding IclR family transcriptional regulator
VLDLFDERRPACTPEEIAADLQVSLVTAYRYLRLLMNSGLLQRVEHSRYALGPRIIMMDHFIRKADPVLREGIPVMRELVEQTGFDCVTTGLFGQQVLDTHREVSGMPATLAYGRGRPRPLFRGAAPKVLLATFASAQLHRSFDQNLAEIQRSDLPTEWPAFRRYFAAIRKAGHYVSPGELEPQVASVAAPILKPDGTAWSALSLVMDSSRLSIVDTAKLANLVMEAARRIGQRLLISSVV